jgi:N-acetylglucosamine malate deacetylase 1
MNEKLDILAFAAHPDDVEISAGGTVVRLVSEGKRVGIVDLTRGELGTRGSAELRAKEAQASGKILGLSARVNLDLGDGFFTNDKSNQLLLIAQIRRFRPEIVMCNALSDRHPDHAKGAKLAADACFLSGLSKIETKFEGNLQEAWRPRLVIHYIQDYDRQPDFVFDITAYFENKMAAIQAFSSQFYDPESAEPETPISKSNFFEMLRGRAISHGRPAGFDLAEGFNVERIFGVEDIFDVH